MDFTTIYNVHYDRVFHVSLSVIRDRQLAEDNVQETFIKVYKKLDSLQESDKVGAWLCVIATRTAIDFIRRERKIGGCPMELDLLDSLGKEAGHNVAAEVEAKLLKELLDEKMEDFTIEDKKLLVLKMEKGLKEREIAKALEMNPATVKSKIHRARKKLKERMAVELSA
ncbi:sigma-70 family RNA polymerase sigma factor [Sutcliffiella horikoshii]|uniref:Sigma-70 family RNA polymerase sigma factor n=1 Tax=Sutcliffiella horikoshii TaxID=79883 RepID=A0A5D4SY07_9BACI|nr:sigma-70 family RNA polymerase sigma factor [Sutcliffiella horikoshii]TYS68185.1 sigma-70 family RNA polymerase sigma factor [Sutcliffiella horikoshii]